MSLQDNHEMTTESARLDSADRADRVERLRDELIQQMLERGSCDVEYPKANGSESLFAYLDEDVALKIYEDHGTLIVKLLTNLIQWKDMDSKNDAALAEGEYKQARFALEGLLRKRMESVCTKLAKKGVSA